MTLREATKQLCAAEQLQEMNGPKRTKNISRFRSNQVLKRQTENKRWWHLISKQKKTKHRKGTIIKANGAGVKKRKKKKKE